MKCTGMTGADFQKGLSAVICEVENLLRTVDPAAVDHWIDALIKAKRIFFAGAGRSRMMLSSMAMRFMHIGMTAHVVGEVTAPAITRGDLLLIASGSGETPTIVMIAEKAQKAGASVALITLQEASTLAKISDICLALSDESIKESVQIGATSFEQATLLLGDLLVCMTAQKLGIVNPNRLMGQLHSNLE